MIDQRVATGGPPIHPDETPSPPHNDDAERAVLGACLCDRDVIVELADRLQPGDFADSAHALIFRVLLDLYDRQVPPDLITVTDELRRRGALERVGAEPYLAGLIADSPTTVHAGYYAGLVADLAGRRRVIEAGTQIVRIGYDEARAWDDVAAETEALLAQALSSGPAGDPIEPMHSVVAQYVEHMDDGANRLTGFGYRRLDELIGGIEDGDLAIVAGRPSSGKTAFALGAARHVAARLRRRVLVISLETRADQLLHRMLAQETGIDSRKIGYRGQRLNDHERFQIETAGKNMADWPLAIDASGEGRVESVISRTLAYSMRQGLDLLIVDGLWLMEWAAARGDRVREVGKISRSLKLLAMRLGIPVIALHQLNRASMSRRDPTPVLTDLRESGDVEQDADLVLFVHRPGMIDPTIQPEITHIIVAKHRQGPVGTVGMRFEPHATRFVDAPSPLRLGEAS